jgi:hypothetical protein
MLCGSVELAERESNYFSKIKPRYYRRRDTPSTYMKTMWLLQVTYSRLNAKVEILDYKTQVATLVGGAAVTYSQFLTKLLTLMFI